MNENRAKIAATLWAYNGGVEPCEGHICVIRPALKQLVLCSRKQVDVLALVSRYSSKGNCGNPLCIPRDLELHIGLLGAMIVNLNAVPALYRAFFVSGSHVGMFSLILIHCEGTKLSHLINLMLTWREPASG